MRLPPEVSFSKATWQESLKKGAGCSALLWSNADCRLSPLSFAGTKELKSTYICVKMFQARRSRGGIVSLHVRSGTDDTVLFIPSV